MLLSAAFRANVDFFAMTLQCFWHLRWSLRLSFPCGLNWRVLKAFSPLNYEFKSVNTFCPCLTLAQHHDWETRFTFTPEQTLLKKAWIIPRNLAIYRLKVCGNLLHTVKNCTKVHAYQNNRHRENAVKCREWDTKVHAYQNNRHRENAVKCREWWKNFRLRRNFLEKPQKERISSNFVCITFLQYWKKIS